MPRATVVSLGIFVFLVNTKSILVKYTKKQFLISLLLYGSTFTGLMMLMDEKNRTLSGFSFFFFGYGIAMALFSHFQMKKSLESIGITDLNEITTDDLQVRTMDLHSSWNDIHNALHHDETYTVLDSTGTKVTVKRKYYTTEYTQKVNVELKGDLGSTTVKVSNIPNTLIKNDISLSHRVVNDMLFHLKQLDSKNSEATE